MYHFRSHERLRGGGNQSFHDAGLLVLQDHVRHEGEVFKHGVLVPVLRFRYVKTLGDSKCIQSTANEEEKKSVSTLGMKRKFAF